MQMKSILKNMCGIMYISSLYNAWKDVFLVDKNRDIIYNFI